MEASYSVTVKRQQQSLFGAPPGVAAAAASAVAAHDPARPCSHSVDFASATWYGVPYKFTESQRSIVAVLWNAFEQGTPDVAGRTLLREADSYAEDIRDLFRGHAAWDRMIRRSSKVGGPAGFFRLCPPVEGGAP